MKPIYLESMNDIKSILYKSAFFLFLLSLLLIFKLKAQDYTSITNEDKIKEITTAVATKVSSVQSEFTQVKKIDFLDQPIESKGLFFFQKSNKLRWEYISPYKYLIIFNDKDIMIKTEDQVTVYDVKSNKVFKEINDLMVGMIDGSLLTDEEHFSTTFAESTDHYIIKLKPLQDELKSLIQTIEIMIDKNNFAVTQISMYESEEDYTTIRFENRKINEPIPKEMFLTKNH